MSKENDKIKMNEPLLVTATSITATSVNNESTSSLQMLTQHDGLLIREKLFWSQVVIGACEKRTQFTVAPWSQDMPERLDETQFATVESQPLFEIRESSPCCLPYGRYLCHQHRQAKFAVYPPLGGTGIAAGWPDTSIAKPMMIVERPFRCTIVCCCTMFNRPVAYTQVPSNMKNSYSYPTDMKPEDIPVDTIGMVDLNWKWWNAFYPCLFTFDIHNLQNAHHNEVDRSPSAVPYSIQVPQCMGNGWVNCCAPTCFNPIMSMPIIDNHTGAVVGEIQNQWPGCNVRGLCQGNSQADNFVVKYPQDADASVRASILSALMLINLALFEKRANQNQ